MIKRTKKYSSSLFTVFLTILIPTTGSAQDRNQITTTMFNCSEMPVYSLPDLSSDIVGSMSGEVSYDELSGLKADATEATFRLNNSGEGFVVVPYMEIGNLARRGYVRFSNWRSACEESTMTVQYESDIERLQATTWGRVGTSLVYNFTEVHDNYLLDSGGRDIGVMLENPGIALLFLERHPNARQLLIDNLWPTATLDSEVLEALDADCFTFLEASNRVSLPTNIEICGPFYHEDMPQVPMFIDEARRLTAANLECDQGIATSCFDVGNFYLNGNSFLDGQPVDSPEIAQDFFERACVLGDARSCRDIAGLLRDYSSEEISGEAQEFYERGCELGDAISCNVISLFNREIETVDPMDVLRNDCRAGEAVACSLGIQRSLEADNFEGGFTFASYLCDSGDEQACGVVSMMADMGIQREDW
jgi:hypothetical protein